MNTQIQQLKLDIANLVTEVRQLKPQRKTINFTGIRTMSPNDAATRVSNIQFELRHLYIVYALLRGKTLDMVEPNRKTEPSQWQIERYMEKYSELVES